MMKNSGMQEWWRVWNDIL